MCFLNRPQVMNNMHDRQRFGAGGPKGKDQRTGIGPTGTGHDGRAIDVTDRHAARQPPPARDGGPHGLVPLQ